MLKFRFDGKLEQAHYQLFDSKGAQVLQGRVQSNEGSIEVQSLQAGTYFFRIANTDTQLTRQVIVE